MPSTYTLLILLDYFLKVVALAYMAMRWAYGIYADVGEPNVLLGCAQGVRRGVDTKNFYIT